MCDMACFYMHSSRFLYGGFIPAIFCLSDHDAPSLQFTILNFARFPDIPDHDHHILSMSSVNSFGHNYVASVVSKNADKQTAIIK